jgi:hypothetical protein
MTKPIKSHFRDGVQYYWEYPETNKEGQKAYRFIQRLLILGVPKDEIETTDLEHNNSPAVRVYGKWYKSFGSKSLEKALTHKKLVKV